MRFLKKICNRIFPKSIPTPIIVENITLSPSLLLNNRKVLITGGTSGIGFAIAKACINAGAAVVITGRNKERINKAVHNLEESTNSTSSIMGYVMDI